MSHFEMLWMYSFMPEWGQKWNNLCNLSTCNVYIRCNMLCYIQSQSNDENKTYSDNFIFKCSKTRYAILTLTRKDKWNRFSIVFPNDVGSVMNSKNPTGVLP